MARASPLVLYIVTRMFLAIPMLLILLTLVFIILRAIPGDPVTALYGGRAPPEVVAAARRQLGLDQPIYIQYADYLASILRGDLGTSLTLYRGQLVTDRILQVFPATLELSLYSMLVAATVGISSGVLGGRLRDTPADVGLRLYGIVIFVVPIYWLGLMLQLVFAVGLRWLPASGRLSGEFPRHVTGMYTIDALIQGRPDMFFDAASHLVLPCITLGLVLSGFFTRIVRVNMLQTLQSDFVEAARARGVREGAVVYRHAFKNALIPVITVMGLTFAALLGGAILTEYTFSLEGMGRELLVAILNDDYTMVQGIVVVFAGLVIVVSLLVDIANALIDPRIKY